MKICVICYSSCSPQGRLIRAFTRAAIIKCHSLMAIVMEIYLFIFQSGAWKSEVKVSEGVRFLRASLLSFHMAVLSESVYITFLLLMSMSLLLLTRTGVVVD